MADQQYLYLLWVTRNAARLPTYVQTTLQLYNTVHQLLYTTNNNKRMTVFYNEFPTLPGTATAPFPKPPFSSRSWETQQEGSSAPCKLFMVGLRGSTGCEHTFDGTSSCLPLQKSLSSSIQRNNTASNDVLWDSQAAGYPYFLEQNDGVFTVIFLLSPRFAILLAQSQLGSAGMRGVGRCPPAASHSHTQAWPFLTTFKLTLEEK